MDYLVEIWANNAYRPFSHHVSWLGKVILCLNRFALSSLKDMKCIIAHRIFTWPSLSGHHCVKHRQKGLSNILYGFTLPWLSFQCFGEMMVKYRTVRLSIQIIWLKDLCRMIHTFWKSLDRVVVKMFTPDQIHNTYIISEFDFSEYALFIFYLVSRYTPQQSIRKRESVLTLTSRLYNY